MMVGYPNDRVFGRHSGILICVNGDMNFFHWDQKNIVLEKLEGYKGAGNIYHRKLNFLPTSSPILFAMLARFRKIALNTRLAYSMIAESDAKYNERGIFESATGLPELSSCVGFCINVLRGFLVKTRVFIDIEDWSLMPIEGHENTLRWMQEAKELYPNLSEEIYRRNHRRIKVHDLALAAYAKPGELPVRKKFIEDRQPYFDDYVADINVI